MLEETCNRAKLALIEVKGHVHVIIWTCVISSKLLYFLFLLFQLLKCNLFI